MTLAMSNDRNNGSQAQTCSEDGKLVRAAEQILEEARSGGFGHNRMTMEDARAIAAVLREYCFSGGLSGSRDQMSMTNPEMNPVSFRSRP